MTLNRTSLRTSDTLTGTIVGINNSTRSIQVPRSTCMVPLDVRNERDQPVTLGDPWACDAVWFSPKLVAPGESWGGAFMIVHPLPGQYRVRSELLWSGERNFYSDFATVTVQP